MLSSDTRFIIAAALVIIVCLIPVLQSDLYSDDLPNFQYKTIATADESVLERAAPGIEHWKGYGRYAPLSFIWMEFVFKHFTTLASYKLFIFFMNLLAVASFLLLLQSINKSMTLAVWLVCYAAVIQFRVSYHDAYTSLNGQYQLLSICIFITLFFYHRCLVKGNLINLIVSLLFLLASMLTSEAGLSALLLIPVVAFTAGISFRKFITSFIPFVLLSSCYLGYLFYLRSNIEAGEGYVGLQASFDPASMLELFFKELYSSLPLSNLQNKPAIPLVLLHKLRQPVNILSVLIIAGCAWYVLYKKIRSKSGGIYNSLFYVAGALMIVPALFILPSVKYQQEVAWGSAYLPVFIQNFGSATLLACIFYYLLNNDAVKATSAFSVFITLCILVTFLFNHSQINARAFNVSFPARVLVESVESGILKPCAEGSTIILGHDFYHKSPKSYEALFKRLTGKKYKVYDEGDSIPHSNLPCYFLDCVPGKKVVVILATCDSSKLTGHDFIDSYEKICDIDVIPEDGITGL